MGGVNGTVVLLVRGIFRTLFDSPLLEQREGEFNWLERLPVTQEAAGSDPVALAKWIAF